MTCDRCNWGDAQFDSEGQAEYVADGLRQEFGTTWAVVPSNGHWHVVEQEGDE